MPRALRSSTVYGSLVKRKKAELTASFGSGRNQPTLGPPLENLELRRCRMGDLRASKRSQQQRFLSYLAEVSAWGGQKFRKAAGKRDTKQHHWPNSGKETRLNKVIYARKITVSGPSPQIPNAFHTISSHDFYTISERFSHMISVSFPRSVQTISIHYWYDVDKISSSLLHDLRIISV